MSSGSSESSSSSSGSGSGKTEENSLGINIIDITDSNIQTHMKKMLDKSSEENAYYIAQKMKTLGKAKPAIEQLKAKCASLTPEELMFITENCRAIPITAKEFGIRRSQYNIGTLKTRAAIAMSKRWDEMEKLHSKIYVEYLSATVWLNYIREYHPDLVKFYQNYFFTSSATDFHYKRSIYELMDVDSTGRILDFYVTWIPYTVALAKRIKSVRLYKGKEETTTDVEGAAKTLGTNTWMVQDIIWEDKIPQFPGVIQSNALQILADKAKEGGDVDGKTYAAMIRLIYIPKISVWLQTKNEPHMSKIKMIYQMICEFSGSNAWDLVLKEPHVTKSNPESTEASYGSKLNQIMTGPYRLYCAAIASYRAHSSGNPDGLSTGAIKPVLFLS